MVALMLCERNGAPTVGREHICLLECDVMLGSEREAGLQ